MALFNLGIYEEIEQREKICLLGLFMANKSVNREAFKTMMQSLWRLKGRVDSKDVGFNLF